MAVSHRTWPIGRSSVVGGSIGAKVRVDSKCGARAWIWHCIVGIGRSRSPRTGPVRVRCSGWSIVVREAHFGWIGHFYVFRGWFQGVSSLVRSITGLDPSNRNLLVVFL